MSKQTIILAAIGLALLAGCGGDQRREVAFAREFPMYASWQTLLRTSEETSNEAIAETRKQSAAEDATRLAQHHQFDSNDAVVWAHGPWQ